MGLFDRGSRPGGAEEGAPTAAEAHAAAIRAGVGLFYGAEPERVAVRPVPGKPFAGEIVAWDRGDHWHLHTVGLSTPAEEGSTGERPYELSLRCERSAAAFPLEGAPPWPVALLASLAGYVLETGRDVGPGARLENRTPLDGDPASAAHHLLFVPDRLLRRLDGPTGVVALLQAVPVTDEELARAKAGAADAIVADLATESPLLVARLRR